MSNQELIQKRSFDPFSPAESDILNNKQAALVGLQTKGILKDGEVTVENDTFVVIKPGYFLKDRVNIKLIEKLSLDCSTFNDGFYFVVLDYVYAKTIPVPTAEFKVITLNTYLADPDRYLFLAEARFDSGSISYIAYETTNGTVDEKRPLITYGNHNSLENIQGGNINSYYHLTEAEFTALSTLPTVVVSSHLDLANIQGGESGQYNHLTNEEYQALRYLIEGDLDSFRNTSFFVNGGTIVADKLDGYDSSDFSLVNHNHYHSSLLDKQGEGEYHLDETQFNSYIDVITDYETNTPDADKLDGLNPDDYSLVGHNHEHNALLNLQGGLLNEYNHLTENEHTSLLDLLNDPNATYNNAEHLELHDDAYFAVSTHTHIHNLLENTQGGDASNKYHFTQSEHDTLSGILDGTISAPNADKLDDITTDGFSPMQHTHQHTTMKGIQGNGEYHVSSKYYDAMTNQTFPPTATNYFLTVSEFNSLFSGYTGSYDHNQTVGLQGGDTNERMHATDYEHTSLISGGATTIHTHSNYYTKTDADVAFINVTGDSFLNNATLDMNSHIVENLVDPHPTSSELPHVYGFVTKHFADVALAASFKHNSLNGVQGLVGDYAMHVTASQYADLQSNISTTIHTHDSLYYDKLNMPYINVSGGTINGNLAMSGNNIIGLPLPADDHDIVNKEEALGHIVPGTGTGDTYLTLWDQDTPPEGYSFLENEKTLSAKQKEYTLTYENPHGPSTVEKRVRAEGVIIDQNTVIFFITVFYIDYDHNYHAYIDIFNHNVSSSSLGSHIRIEGYLVSNIIVIDGKGYFITCTNLTTINPSNSFFNVYEFPLNDFMDPNNYNVIYTFSMSRAASFHDYFLIKNGALNSDGVNLFSDYDNMEYDSVNGEQFSNLGFIKRLDCFKIDDNQITSEGIIVFRFEENNGSWSKTLDTAIDIDRNNVIAIQPFSLSRESSYYQIIYNQNLVKTIDINSGNFYDSFFNTSNVTTNITSIIASNNSNGKYNERILIFDGTTLSIQEGINEVLGTTEIVLKSGNIAINNEDFDELLHGWTNIPNLHYLSSSDKSVQFLIHARYFPGSHGTIVSIYKISDATLPAQTTTTKKYRMLENGASVNNQRALYYITKSNS